MGELLVTKSLDYLENELPGLMQDADRFEGRGLCYLLNGSVQETLEFFEQRVGHGHIGDWFWLRLLPWWDPLRNDPRFTALDQRVEKIKAEQLALLRH